MNLRFLGGAGPDHGFLDQPCRIFADLDPGPRGAHQHHPTCLSEFEGRLGVFVDEYLLDCGSSRGMIADQRLELVGERGKAPRQRGCRVGPNLSVRDMDKSVAFGLDQSPAGGAKPGVEAENPQASFSNSSSDTS